MANDTSLSTALWQDVCLASAWFHRAQTLYTTSQSNTAITSNATTNHTKVTSSNSISNNNIEDNDMIITSAERSLALYQSCYKSLKNIRQHSKHSTSSHHGASLKNIEPPTDSTDNEYTINLELRMAQTLRFLALLHSSTTTSSVSADTVVKNENGIQISNDQQSKEVGDSEQSDKQSLDMAIKYHDMAVSIQMVSLG